MATKKKYRKKRKKKSRREPTEPIEIIVLIIVIVIGLIVAWCGRLDLDEAENLTEKEFKGGCIEITYDDLKDEEKCPDKETKVKCKGVVSEVKCEKKPASEYESSYLVALETHTYDYLSDSDYTYDIWVLYVLGDNPKISVGDKVTMYGYVWGTTEFGKDEVRVPQFYAVYIDIGR